MKTRIIKIQFRALALICFTILANISKGQEFEILFPANGIPEGFETGVKPAGWESRIIEGTLPWNYQSGGYLYNPLNAFSGTNNAIFQAQSREAIAKLITPTIDLKRSEEGEAPITIKPTLVFWHAQVDWSGDLDELKVYYRENITSEWKLLDHFTSEVRNWTKQEILLPDAAKTSTCQIAFEGISNWGYGTCIDEVRIEERGIIPRKVETFQVKQYNDNYPTGSENNPFSNIKVLVSGNTNEIPVNSITLNYSGTDINDLSSIRLFHTRDSLFKVSTPLNANVTYNGNKIILTAPLFNLSTGTNYIWIALGIDNNSPHGNIVDFFIDPNDVVLGSESFPLSNLAPNGTATIHESLIYTDFEGAYDWTKTSLWEIGEPLGTGAYDATYAYTESKVLATNLNGNYYSDILISDPEIVTTNVINAKYYQNLNLVYKRWLSIDQNDKASVKISNDGSSSWATIYNNNNDVADRGWKTITHNISSFATRKDQVSIQFAIDESNYAIEYGGWNIDNFAITGEYIHTDVGIKEIISPVNKCGLTNSEEVVVVVKNYGGETVETPFEIGFSIDGGELYKKQLFNNGSGIIREQEITFTFTEQHADLSSPGLKNLKFTTFLEGDQDLDNNTLTTNFYVFPTVDYPYLTSFESSSSHWYPSGTNSSWQWGTPNGTNIKTASNGNRVWATALSQNYNHSEMSYLESPCFDLSTAEMPVIAFDYMMQVEQSTDGLSLEYSIDGGATWSILPADVNYAQNWFDTPNISSLGTTGWSVNKTEYVTAKSLLPSDVDELNGIKFRFVFGSNASVQNEGVALDMIKVYELPYDLGITELVSPTTACEIGEDQTLELKLKNFGYRTVPVDAVIPIAIQVNDGEIKTENITISAEILQNGEYTFTTTNTFDLFSAGTYDIMVYTNLDVDDDTTNDTLTTSVDVLGMPEFALGPDIGVEDFTPPVTLDAGAGYTSYSWYELPDDVTSIGSEQNYDVSDEGDFRVVITKYINAELTCEAQDDISVMLSDKDVGVADITNLKDDCEHDSPISPQVVIQSFRNSPFNGSETIPLVVEVDGEVVLTENYTPADTWGNQDDTTYNYTFAGTIDLSEAKSYNISIYTALTDDLDRSNDNEDISVTTYGIPDVNILVRTLQDPETFVAANNIITTSADTLVFKATDGFSSYQWKRKKPDEATWTTLPSGQTYSPISKSTFDYRVTVVDPNGCGTPETNNETVSVSAFDLSLISINSPTASSCFTNEPIPLSIKLKNSGQDIYPIGTEITLTANTPIGDQNETLILESPLGVGEEYNYTFSKEYNFPIGLSYIRFEALTQNDPLVDNNEKTIEVNTNPSPTVDIEHSKIFKIFEQNETYIITPTYSDPVDENDSHEYSWQDFSYFPDYTIYDPSLYSTYEVTVTNSFGCTDTDAVELITNDLQISAISSPFTDCELTDDTPVIFVLRNNGNSTYNSGTSIDVDLYLNDNFISQETIVISENLQPKATQTITLSSILNLNTLTSATIQIDISSAKEEVHSENNSLNKSVYALGFPSPNLGADRDVYAWQEELDPGYYDMYLWQDESTERILTATENGTYTVTVTDFSGCQGSDEVTLTLYKDDIELLEVLEPTTGCGLTNQEPITFRIQNNGNYPLPVGREIVVGYTYEGLEYPGTHTLTQEVAVGGVFNVTLSQTMDLSQPKEHTALFWVDMVNDGFNHNNSITLNMNSYPEVNLILNVASGTVSNVPILLDAGAGYETYQWQYEGVDVTSEQTYNASQSGIYSVLVTDDNGCQGYAEVDLTILMPDYGITQLISPKSDCELADNQAVTVEITNQGNDILSTGDIITLSLWQNGELLVNEDFAASESLQPGAFIEHTLNHRVNLSAKNQHAIAVKAKHLLDNNPANDSLMQEVVSYGFPTVDLGSDRVVKTASAVLDAGEGFATYLWSNGSIERNLTISETGVYSVVVTDVNGCSATDEVSITFITSDYQISLLSPVSACSLSDAETVKVSITNMGIETLPMGSKIGLTFGIDGKNIANEAITVSAKLEPQQTVAYTFTYKANLSVSKVYALSVTLESSLDQDATNNTASVNVEHFQLPVVNLGEDRTSYNPLTLDAGSGFESYLWNDGSTSQTLEVTQSGTYWVKVTDANGCEGYDEVNLNVYNSSMLAVSEVVSPLGQDCERDEIPVAIVVTNGRDAAIAKNEKIQLNYQVNDGTVVSEEFELVEVFEVDAQITHVFDEQLNLETGSYGIKCWVNYSSIPGEAFEQNTTINPSPVVDLGDDLEVTFPYTILSGLTDLDFLWSTGETTPTIVVDEPGEYWLIVTNEFGCQLSDTVVLTLTSVHQIPGSGTVVTVYPNPADQWITINIEPKLPALFTIELISQAGQVVYSKNITQNQPFTHRVDVNKFTPGVYLLRVSSGGEWVTVKVVIQR